MRISRRRKGEGGEQGRIHGRTVADGWAGAVKKCYGPTDRPTDTARCRVACPRLKSKLGYMFTLVTPLPKKQLVIHRWAVH